MQRLRAREILLASAFVFCASCKKPESVATTTAQTATVSIAPVMPSASASAAPLEADGGGVGISWGRPNHPENGSVRMGTMQVTGRLPPEVVQRIVRRNFARFRLCYEDGVRKNPSLTGRVTTRFTIDRDGTVKGAPEDAGSDLPDASVVQCVLRAFSNVSYPQPEDGVVTVVVPLLFSPT